MSAGFPDVSNVESPGKWASSVKFCQKSPRIWHHKKRNVTHLAGGECIEHGENPIQSTALSQQLAPARHDVHWGHRFDRVPRPLTGKAAVVIQAPAAVGKERGKREDEAGALRMGNKGFKMPCLLPSCACAEGMLQLPKHVRTITQRQSRASRLFFGAKKREKG